MSVATRKKDAAAAGRLTRKSRHVLGDVSNRRRTRSSASKAQVSESTTKGLRRSARLSGGQPKEVPTAKKAEKESLEVPSKVISGSSAGRKRITRKGTAEAECGKEHSASKQPRRRGRTRTNDPKDKATGGCGRSISNTRRQGKSKQGRGSKRLRSEIDVAEDEPHECIRRTSRRSSKLKKQRNSHFVSETNHNLVQLPLDPQKFMRGISTYDASSKGDVLETPEYATDIFQRLYLSETHTRPKPYMHNQIELNATMRTILIDWLVEVHAKFRLQAETLYLCVNIIDRYCAATAVDREEIQLVGVTALLLASKYEEIYPPEVRDCVYITDRAFTRQEVLDMELEILRVLEFKMSVPTAYPFLQRFLSITEASQTMKMAANYYMDRVLQEYVFLEFRPSLVAAAAVCLAINHPEIREMDELNGKNPGLPQVLLTYSGFSAADILRVAQLMAEKVSAETVTASKRELVAVKLKYESSRYNKVSLEFEGPDVDDIAVQD